MQAAVGRREVAAGRGKLQKQIAQWTAWNEDRTSIAEDYGYEQIKLNDGSTRSAMNELVRWRLWDRTGGG